MLPKLFKNIFWRARVCWPLRCLCRPFVFLGDVWIRTQRAAVASRLATTYINPSRKLCHPNFLYVYEYFSNYCPTMQTCFLCRNMQVLTCVSINYGAKCAILGSGGSQEGLLQSRAPIQPYQLLRVSSCWVLFLKGLDHDMNIVLQRPFEVNQYFLHMHREVFNSMLPC
jgi:hypothetical protein